MPIFFVNPASKKRKTVKKRTPVRGSIKRVSTGSTKAKKPSKKKPAARKPATTNPKQGKKKMAKKLYGAAAAARKKRLAKLKRKRKSPARRAKKNPAKRVSAKRRAAGLKAARTRKRRASAKRNPAVRRRRKRRVTASAPVRRRRRVARKSPVRRRRRTALRANPAKRRVKRRRYRRNPGRAASGRRAARGMTRIAAARGSIKAAKRRGGLSGAFAKRFKMRTNPGGIMQAVKTAVPIAGAYYVSKVVANKLGDIPALSGVMGTLNVGGYALGKPLVSGLLLAGTHYGTKNFTGKKAPLRSGLMLGSALALLDSVIGTFAPASVKAMMGLEPSCPADVKAVAEKVATSGYGSLGEYVSMGEYVAQGNHGGYGSLGEYVQMGDFYAGDNPADIHAIHPIADYVNELSGIDAELGAIESGAETGMSNGIFANGW